MFVMRTHGRMRPIVLYEFVTEPSYCPKGDRHGVRLGTGLTETVPIPWGTRLGPDKSRMAGPIWGSAVRRVGLDSDNLPGSGRLDAEPDC
jgi:hypothetical protein